MISILVEKDSVAGRVVGYSLKGHMVRKSTVIVGYVSRLGRGRFGYHKPLP